MQNDIYKKLAKHLDDLPGGFPPTDSGVEIRILKRLFSPQEAELALHLTLIPEEPRVVARRAKMQTTQAQKQLEAMAQKGLILRIEGFPGKQMYMAAQYIVGIWEFHVNDLDPQLVHDMEEYIPTLFPAMWKRPQLRTIPIESSIHNELKVMTYEKAQSLVQAHERFSVNPCICRRERKLAGKGCDKPLETCLTFGMAADYSIKNGLGRAVGKSEILSLLKKASEIGLVLQPSNSEEALFICCCCGCCCLVLRTLKAFPNPAEMVSSPFMAKVNNDNCDGCGVCQDRCQMEALEVKDGKICLHTHRCIGCGLCVSTCPTDSITLHRKPDICQPKIHKNMLSAVIEHGRAREKLDLPDLFKMQIKSKIDRLLTLSFNPNRSNHKNLP